MKSQQISEIRSIGVLFFTIIVVMIGFGIIFPIMPFYLDSFNAGGREMGYIVSIYAVLQLIFSPIFGTLSEKHGRKPLIAIGVFGTAVSHILFAVSNTMLLVFVARAAAGIFSAAAMPIGMAYVSDVTSEEKRARAMGWLSGAMGAGVVLGPGIGGLLSTESLTLPFYIAAGLSLFAFGLIVAFLPESLSKETRGNGDGKSAKIGEMWEAITSPIGAPLFVSFFFTFCLTVLEVVLGFYFLERYGYGTKEVGFVLMLAGIIYALVPSTLTGPLVNKFGDVPVLRGALIISGLGFAMLLLPENMMEIILVAVFFVSGNSLLPSISASLISKKTTVGQGLSMGLIQSFNSMGRIVGPVIAGYLFEFDINLPFLGCAVIMFIGYLVVLFWVKTE